MCLQDFQMGRRTTQKVQSASGANILLNPDPRRLRIIVAGSGGVVQVLAPASTDGGGGIIAAGGWQDLVNASPFGFTLVLRLEDYGTLLLGNLEIQDIALTATYGVTEVYAAPDLDNLISGAHHRGK